MMQFGDFMSEARKRAKLKHELRKHYEKHLEFGTPFGQSTNIIEVEYKISEPVPLLEDKEGEDGAPI